MNPPDKVIESAMEIATLAGGCFWCTEAVFKRLKGVMTVIPGYTGGTTANPTYEQVCSGKTGHAEAIQITFDPKIISYERLLDVFWKLHNPTTRNQQGADTGTEYRSSIFTHNEDQKRQAMTSKEKVGLSGWYKDPIVTEIVPFTAFYPAEDYQKNYYEKNTYQPYCQIVIDPKIQKLFKEFGEDIKEEY